MTITNSNCHDCNVQEGQIHIYGCDMERCPLCYNQLISCDCRYKELGFDFNINKKYAGLPKNIYEKGLTEEQEKEWLDILNKKGRVPYIILPVFCRKCLKPFPDFFKVSNEEWKKLPKNLHNKVLCKECYNKIRKYMDCLSRDIQK